MVNQAEVGFKVVVDLTELNNSVKVAKTIEQTLARINKPEQAALLAVGLKNFEKQTQSLKANLKELERAYLLVDKARELAAAGGKGSLQGLSGPEASRVVELSGLSTTASQTLDNIEVGLREALTRVGRQLTDFGGQLAGINQEFVRQFIDSLPTLEATLLSAFSGFGRRFRATLQFAISGAIIFAFQRLIREAVTTAIEVERAFADIATALDFDRTDTRGAAAFENQLERLRVGALAIADEFNALPTVVNRVAFQMVARFQLASNALEATRAQIIALKVSTIDTEEILRSLTATAEAFALETVRSTEGQSLQARTLARENASIEQYTKSLDLATVIQQEWGVSLEDTIEGTGRSAEVFRQLGFSLEQTAAIVASTVFQLGLSGTQVAEKLNRSIGQITSPAIRNQLLDLAAASREFTLTFDDFESGATALEALSAQFANLQRVEPATARRIAQIVGQRRETEVVSAVLANRDFQLQIVEAADDAAGAAERRFEFLQETISEILFSIGAQFEELSQNLERLGALSPFRLLLTTADKFLDILNFLLTTINSITTALGNIPIIGGVFRDILPNVIAFGFALGAIRRSLEAINQLQLLGFSIAGVRAGAAAAVTKLIGSGGASGGHTAVSAKAQAQAASVALGALTLTAGKFGVLINSLILKLSSFATRLGAAFVTLTTTSLTLNLEKLKELFLTRGKNTASLLGRTTRGLFGFDRAAPGTVAPGLAAGASAVAITAIVTGWIVVVSKFVDGIFTANRSMKAYTETLNELNLETDRAVALGKLTELEARVKRGRDKQAALGGQETQASLTEGLVNIFGSAGGQIILEQFIEGLAEDFNDTALIERKIRLAGGGVDNFFEVFISKFLPTENRAALSGFTDEGVRANLAINFQDELGPALIETLRLQLIDTADIIGETISVSFFNRLAGLTARLKTASTQVEIEALEEELTKLFLEFDAVLIDAGADIELLQETLKTIRQKIKQTTTDLDFGRISPGLAAAQFEKQRADLLSLAEGLEGIPGFEDVVIGFFDEAEVVLRLQSAAVQAGFDQRRELLELFATDEARLAGVIDALKDEIRALLILGDQGAARQARVELAKAQQAEVEFFQQQLEEQASFRQQFARTQEERLRIQRQLAHELAILAFKQALRGPEGLSAAAALYEAAFQATIIGDRMVEDIERARIVNEARQAGPILNKITALNAQLAGLRFDLSKLGEGTQAFIATQIDIATVLAQRAQALLRDSAAAISLQAGVNDTLLGLKGQITILSRELQLTELFIGRDTAAWRGLKLRQKEVQLALANAILELRDLERRLDSDITNAFEQAQFDLIAVLEKLAAPDLGDLEKARLELEKKNAEAAARRAFFDDKLFNLNFDFETGEIGLSQYINALKSLLEQVDVSTDQGKKIFLEISNLIDSLTSDISDFQFNIPGSIRLPTLFEVRRSLAADQLGVNYQDNRVQLINLTIDDPLTLDLVLTAIDSAFGLDLQRVTAGNVGVTLGPF